MEHIPNELVNHISQYCKTPDFISLRNTCSRFRRIGYIPKRDIVIGTGIRTRAEVKIEIKTFLILSITLLIMSIILLIIGIILFCVDMGNIQDLLTAQITTGVIFLTLSIIVLIIDILFMLTSIRLTRRRSMERITV